MFIAENIEKIRKRAQRSARHAGRDPDGITIVAVTKTVDAERIQEAVSAGISVLGENRVQDAREKIQKIDRAVQWHMIGHLQTNKAREAAALFDMVHSVDSLRVAQALNVEAGKQGKKLPVLVQVNISEEESKSGVKAQEALNLVKSVAAMENLTVQGLMTMPPYAEDPEKSRWVFRSLREMRDRIAEMDIQGVCMTHLSMGMSHDFETAVEEGATLIRIGTAIFGERD
ncbi:MAG: YggS family pyridoxal phosphate-dependent enzyme [bacterium]